MKPAFKEDPKEWRKAAWLGSLGFAVMTSVLRWRHVLPKVPWLIVLCLLACVVVAAAIQPRLFRGFYRFSHRLSYIITELIGRVALAFIFILVVTPLGVLLRLSGKDPLRLRSTSGSETYWRPSPRPTPLDRLF